MSFRAPRRICFDGNEGMIRPGLHPPWPALRINNNLLLWSSASYPPRDGVDSFASTLRREAKDHNKHERPREFLRRNAYRAPCSPSRVPFFEHFRHHDFSAEDIARLFTKQTQIEVLWALP